MSDGTETKFIFCPRCGGLMQPPFCSVCGYDIRPQIAPDNPQPQQGIDPNMPVNEQMMQGQPQPGQNYQAVEATRYQAQKVQKQSKKKIWIPILIAGTVLIVLLILIGPIISLIKSRVNLNNITSQQPPSSSSKPVKKAQTSEEGSEGEETLDKRHFGRFDFDHDTFDVSFYEGMADVCAVTESGAFDPFINDRVTSYRDQSSVFDTTHENHFDSKDQMGPDYYEPFCDCVDEVSYSNQYRMYRDYYYYDDNMGGTRVQADIAYVRLDGSIPNLDKLNREIYLRTAADFLNYLNGSSVYSQYMYSTITFSVDSYITYNDGKKMSILLDAVVHTDDYMMNLDSYIYAINIDLENGKIIENDEILKLDVDFAGKFRQQCLDQNGRNYALDPWTDEEILKFLTDKESNIVFFNPVGVEIGMCYVGQEDILSRGWMTITLKYGSFEKNYLKDSSLANQGTGLINPTSPKYQDLKGTWIHIDPSLAVKEEEDLKNKFPNYDWDSTSGNKLKEQTSEKSSEETSEEDRDDSSEEPKDSETPDENIAGKDKNSGNWLKTPSKMQEYFDKIMGDSDEKINPDEYFKTPKEKGKDVRP